MTAATDGDRPTAEQAVAACDRMIRHHARKIAATHSDLAADDLYQVGAAAVVEYVRGGRYDPARGKLVTALALRVRGEMLDEVRRVSPCSRLHARERKEAGLPASPVERFSEMDAGTGLSQDHNYVARKGGPKLRFDPAHHDPEPADDAETEFLAVCRVLFDGLGETERTLLRCYFVRGMTMKEVGERIGVTEGRVSQRLSAIIGRVTLNEAEAVRLIATREVPS